MNKKIVLMVAATSTALALTTVVLAGLGGKSLWLSADTEPGGSITLDATSLDCPFQEGKFQAKSTKGNEFWFVNNSMTMDDGVFTIEDGGAFWNEDVLNGLYKMDITFTESACLYFSYSSKANGGTDETIDVEAGLNSIKFEKFNPQKVTLYAKGDALKFSKIVFYYTCVADESGFGINYVETHRFGSWSTHDVNGILAPVGTALSAIDASNLRFDTPSGFIYGANVTDLQIAYTEVDSTAVVEGSNPVSVSFVWDENTYSGSDIKLFGYSSSELEMKDAYLSSGTVRQQATDDLPEGLELSVFGEYSLFDEAGETVLAQFPVHQPMELTDEMVKKLDDQPFTKLGVHNMTVTVDDFDASFTYQVYNPEINNISGIYCSDGSLEVAEGTTTDQFLAYVATKTFHITYFEDDESLPHETTLGAENFTLKGDEFDGSSLQVLVPVTYGTYSDTIYVKVNKATGKLIAEYHNDDGVSFMSGKIYRIGLYDNGVAKLYTSKDGDSVSDFSYTLDGTTLSIIMQNVSILFTIDEEGKTFTSYVSSATLLYTLGVDLSDLGGETTLYKGEMYDDNTIVLDMGHGMILNSSFTFDTSDNSIIYFDLAGLPCIGTIDYDKLTMVVKKASAS